MRPTRKPVEPDRDEGAVRVETTKPTAVPGHDHQRIALAGAPPVNKPLGTRPPGFDVASSRREQAGSTDFPLTCDEPRSVQLWFRPGARGFENPSAEGASRPQKRQSACSPHRFHVKRAAHVLGSPLHAPEARGRFINP